MHKVESHMTDDRAQELAASPMWRHGNDLADELAEQAAHRVALGPAEVASVREIDARAAKVRSRLAAILQDVAAKDRRVPVPRTDAGKAAARASLYEQALATTRHDVVKRTGGRGNRLHCRCCLSEVGGT